MIMKKIMKRSFFSVLCFSTVLTVFAQKAPMKFGKIDIEDLKMNVYENDTSAEAVVLCDYGEFDSKKFEFSRHCRIKILKKSGVHEANIRVRVPSRSNIKARTYNLENDEVVVTKMKGESVFKEIVKGNVNAIRFSLPNVKVGSVIEFSYFFNGIPYSWEFQKEIPVIWSELRMERSEYVFFKKNFFGYEHLSIVENNRWVAKEMPAFRKEPYINSINNFLTKFEFEVSEITYPGYYKEFTTSWDKVREVLMKDKDFGLKLTGNMFLNKYAELIGTKDISDYDKVKEAYEFVRNEITWNLVNSLYAYSSFSMVYKEKKGNSAEINLMLISLLRKMEFEANPVVLSTRDNGLLSLVFPSLNKLNYVIAQVKIDDKLYLIDATDKHAPLGLLPKKCLNGEAKVLYENDIKSVSLNTKKLASEICNVNLSLSRDGDLEGIISYQYKDYAAYDFRKEIDEYTSQDDFIKDTQEDYDGLYIDSYKIENIDSIYKTLKVVCDVELEDNVDFIGNNIYVNPMTLEKLDENLFKSDERKYPVDFIHPISKRYILNLNIPEGFSIDQLPENKKVSLPQNKGSFTYDIISNGNNIQFAFHFKINDPIIFPDEYLMLKEFYNLLINKQSEMIVLKKDV